MTWSAALSDTPRPGQEARRTQNQRRALRHGLCRLGRGVHQQMVQKRRIKQGILGIAEGRGRCPFGTERHPLRPWVGRADEHTDPLFPTEKVGDQAQAWSKGLARGLAQLSNHCVFGNSPVCVSRDCTVSESCPETWSGKEGAGGQHGSACLLATD